MAPICNIELDWWANRIKAELHISDEIKREIQILDPEAEPSFSGTGKKQTCSSHSYGWNWHGPSYSQRNADNKHKELERRIAQAIRNYINQGYIVFIPESKLFKGPWTSEALGQMVQSSNW